MSSFDALQVPLCNANATQCQELKGRGTGRECSGSEGTRFLDSVCRNIPQAMHLSRQPCAFHDAADGRSLFR